MTASNLRDRIEQRIKAQNSNVREVERLCGFNPCHLSDVMSGRKKTLKEDALYTVARVLKTTVPWLAHGVGQSSSDFEDMPAKEISERLCNESASRTIDDILCGIVSAGQMEDVSILLFAINLLTRECSFFVTSTNSPYESGYIVDPELSVIANKYLKAFDAQRFCNVSAKKIVRKTGESVYWISDIR